MGSTAATLRTDPLREHSCMTGPGGGCHLPKPEVGGGSQGQGRHTCAWQWRASVHLSPGKSVSRRANGGRARLPGQQPPAGAAQAPACGEGTGVPRHRSVASVGTWALAGEQRGLCGRSCPRLPLQGPFGTAGPAVCRRGLLTGPEHVQRDLEMARQAQALPGRPPLPSSSATNGAAALREPAWVSAWLAPGH